MEYIFDIFLYEIRQIARFRVPNKKTKSLAL